MKNLLILFLLFFSYLSYGQKETNIEIGLMSGVNFNNTFKRSFSNSYGAQTGLRIKFPAYKFIHIQLRATLRDMKFPTSEYYAFPDPIGMPRVASRSINDTYETLDLSLNVGIQIVTYQSFSLDIILGKGRGEILNVSNYDSNRRIQNLTEIYNFSELGLEFHFQLTKNLAFIANTHYFYTSFYELEYAGNNSFQVNANLSYTFSIKKEK